MAKGCGVIFIGSCGSGCNGCSSRIIVVVEVKLVVGVEDSSVCSSSSNRNSRQ